VLPIFAVWNIIKKSRTSEEHARVMNFWGKALGTLSLVHCVAAILHFSGYIPDDNPYLKFYSHALAFPLIIVFVWFASQRVIETHWSRAMFKDLINNKITSMKEIGAAQTDKQIQLIRAEVAEIRNDIFAIRADLKKELVPILRDNIKSEVEIETMLKMIPDDYIEAKIRAELDKVTEPLKLNP
jgi:hypothetical protein